MDTELKLTKLIVSRTLQDRRERWRKEYLKKNRERHNEANNKKMETITKFEWERHLEMMEQRGKSYEYSSTKFVVEN